MRRAPGVSEQLHERGVPVGVEGRLGENEIGIGPLAVDDEQGREQMEALVPGERDGLRIDEQRGQDGGEGRPECYSNSSKLPFSRMSDEDEPIHTS